METTMEQAADQAVAPTAEHFIERVRRPLFWTGCDQTPRRRAAAVSACRERRRLRARRQPGQLDALLIDYLFVSVFNKLPFKAVGLTPPDSYLENDTIVVLMADHGLKWGI